jgi:peroxiredoxin
MKRAFIVLLLLAACTREQQSASFRRKTAQTTTSQEESAPKTEAGDRMPAYSAKFLDGKPFDLAAEKGTVVLLNVWATWCSPCRFETPELQALHEKFAAGGFKVIGVSVDDAGPDVVRQFVTEYKVSYPIALDEEGRIANVLSTTVLPTSVLIDRSGRIVWRKVGPVMPNEIPALEIVVKQAASRY